MNLIITSEDLLQLRASLSFWQAKLHEATEQVHLITGAIKYLEQKHVQTGQPGRPTDVQSAISASLPEGER